MTEETFFEILDEIEKGEFDIQDRSGGNFDDAFGIGVEFGNAEATYLKPTEDK